MDVQAEKHINSRIVTIRRAPSFISKAQGIEVKDFMTSAIQEIGSYFEGGGSTRIGSGLTITEEKILLPEHIGISSEDKEYFKERNKFYVNFYTKVPADGIKLEIGLTQDNNKPIHVDKTDPEKSNLPINLLEYLRYKHALSHPWVAKSELAGKGNQIQKFFVDDPVTASQGKSDTTAMKDEALTFYLQVKSNPEKVNSLLTLLGVDYRDVVGQTPEQTTQLRVDKLRGLVDTRAKDFNDLNKDKNFDVKYKVQMMINTEVLKKVGAKYLITENGESLGNYEELVEFLKDTTTNSDVIGVLNAKLQEAMKGNKKVKAKREIKSDR